MQKLKTFPQKLNENLPKTQGFCQKLNQPELSGPVVFQSGVQNKARHNWLNTIKLLYKGAITV